MDTTHIFCRAVIALHNCVPRDFRNLPSWESFLLTFGLGVEPLLGRELRGLEMIDIRVSMTQKRSNVIALALGAQVPCRAISAVFCDPLPYLPNKADLDSRPLKRT